MIYVEPRGEDPRVIVITRGGAATGEDRMMPGKTIEESRVRKVAEKMHEFDQRKEKWTFEEARK